MSTASPLARSGFAAVARCRDCQAPLAIGVDGFVCDSCGRTMPMVDGVLCLEEGRTPPGRHASDGDGGWDEALFDDLVAALRIGRGPTEDERSAEWHLFLQPARTAVVVGCGYGNVAAALASRCSMVVVTDLDAGGIAFVAERAQQTGLANVVCALGGFGDLPIPDGAVELLVLWDSTEPPRDMASVRRLLTPGGTVVLRISKRRGRSLRRPLREISAWGFRPTMTLIPLPDPRAIPLFLVPDGPDRAQATFLFRTLVALAATGPPGALRAHRWAARMARLASSAFLAPLAARMTSRLATGVIVVATTGGDDRDP